MARLTIVEAVNQALLQEMGHDETVVVLGEDVGIDGGVFRATQGLFEKFGRDRVIDTPLAEAGIVGSSIGMAIAGLKPVAEIQFDGFMYLALNQLINHAARIRNRSRGTFHCPMVLRAPYGGGIRALEHHSESPETYYAHAPGLKLVIPSTPTDAKGLLVSAIRDPDPVIFLEPKRLYRSVKEEVPEELYATPLGEAKKVKEGSDVTLVSWGSMMKQTLEAAQLAEQKGIHAEVLDLRTISPLDENAVLESVKKTGRCVVVQESPRTLGFSSEIAARINDKALYSLQAPVQRVTGYDTIFPLSQSEDFFLPNANRIMNAIDQAMKG